MCSLAYVSLVALLLLTACLGERPLGTRVGAGGSAGEGGGAGSNGGSVGLGGSTSSSGDGGVSDGGVGVGGIVAARLAFEPLSQPAGYASRPLGLITVQVLDAAGILVSGAQATVTLALGNNPSGARLIGFPTASAQAGVAVFESVGLDQVGTGYTFTASAAGLSTATSPPFEVARLPFERVVTGLYGGIVSHLASSTEEPPTLYASGPAGVFRSNNAGGSWTAANFGNSGEVGLVAVDPLNPARVYATPLFGSVSFSGSSTQVTRSDNGGDAWRPLEGLSAGGLAGTDVGALLIDPVSPSIVYAGNAAGVFRSTDAGDTWVRTSFPYGSYELTLDPIAPATLYASAFDPSTSTSHGIYKTIDSGNNWAPVNSPSLPPDIIPNGPQALLATPAGVFVNEYRSTDGGATWVQGATAWDALAYSASNVQRVYSAVNASVQVSNDGGLSFGPGVATGGALINSLAVDATSADRVYAATDSGVFASTNGGVNWSSSSVGITTLLLGAAAIHPSAPDNVFVGGLGGVYRTTNGGVIWLHTELGTGIDDVTALSVDPLNPATVYACTIGALFHRSDDGGVSWSPGVDTGGFAFCYGIAVSGSTLWVPTAGGIRRSIDGGGSWELSTGLDLPTYSVAVAPGGTTLYAGSSEGTYKSLNAGLDWTLMTLDLGDAFLVDPVTPSTVYMGLGCGNIDVATGSGGIRRSTNSGASWEPVVAGACITALLGLADGRLLAVGRGSPPFAVSSDQGQSWQAAGTGIQGEPTGVAASRDGQLIYVPTTLGLYKSVTGGL